MLHKLTLFHLLDSDRHKTFHEVSIAPIMALSQPKIHVLLNSGQVGVFFEGLNQTRIRWKNCPNRGRHCLSIRQWYSKVFWFGLMMRWINCLHKQTNLIGLCGLVVVFFLWACFLSHLLVRDIILPVFPALHSLTLTIFAPLSQYWRGDPHPLIWLIWYVLKRLPQFLYFS